jgi:hypothetical protein
MREAREHLPNGAALGSARQKSRSQAAFKKSPKRSGFRRKFYLNATSDNVHRATEQAPANQYNENLSDFYLFASMKNAWQMRTIQRNKRTKIFSNQWSPICEQQAIKK